MTTTTYSWVDGFSGDWGDGSRWSDGVVPDGTTNATVGGSGVETVTVSTNEAVNVLTLSDSNATLVVSNGATLAAYGGVQASSVQEIDIVGGGTLLDGSAATTLDNTTLVLGSATGFGLLEMNPASNAVLTLGSGLSVNAVSGNIQASGDLRGGIDNQGTITVTSLSLNAYAISNEGTIQGDGSFSASGTNITNAGGAVISVAAQFYGANSLFTNDGTITGASVRIIGSGTLINNGILHADSLYLNVPDFYSYSASFLNTGTITGNTLGLDSTYGYSASDFVSNFVNSGSITEQVISLIGYGNNTGTITLTANGGFSRLSLDNEGTIEVGTGDTLYFSGPNNRSITVDAYGGVISDGIGGSGTITLNDGASLELRNGQLSNTVAFAGGNATLQIDSPGLFSGVLQGLSTGNSIDFKNAIATGATANNTTLTVTFANNTTQSFTLAAPLPTGDFVSVALDGTGGTKVVVTDTPLPPPPTYSWVDGFSGDWGDGSRWSDGVVPDGTTNATVGGSGVETVTVSTNEAVNVLTLSDSNATLVVSNGATLAAYGGVQASSVQEIDIVGGGTLLDGSAATTLDNTTLVLGSATGFGLLEMNPASNAVLTLGSGLSVNAVSGNIQASGDLRGGIDNQGTITVTSLSLNAYAISNEGTIQGDGSFSASGTNITNAGGAVISVAAQFYGANSLFTNDGTITGASVRIIGSGTLINNGILHADSLYLNVPDFYSYSASFLNTGTITGNTLGLDSTYGYSASDFVSNFVNSGSITEQVISLIGYGNNTGTITLTANGGFSRLSLDNEGTIEVGTGDTLTFSGTNNSTIVVDANGALISGGVNGNGTITLNDGTSLALSGSLSNTVVFASGTATLQLNSTGLFSGVLQGLTAGDAIDFKNAIVASASANNTTLTVTFADNTTQSLALAAPLPTGDFVSVALDGTGGTKVVVTRPDITEVNLAALAGVETANPNATIGVKDTAAAIGQAGLSFLGADTQVLSISVSDGNRIALSYSDYSTSAAGLNKVTTGYLNVTDVRVLDVANLELDSRVSAIGILDTAANLGGAVLGTLSSDAKVQTITVSDSNPLGLTYAQYAADGLGLAKITGTTYKLSITAATVASQAALDANSRVQAIAISDTAAALSGAALASLGADAKVKSIAVSTASPITLTYAQYTADSAAFAKITGTYSLNLTGVALASLSAVEQNSRVVGIGVSDTAAKLTSALATLGADSKVNAIVASDGKPLVLSVAQYTGGTQAIGKLPSGTKVSISDTAANLAAALGTLGSDGTVATIAVTDGLPLPLTYAQYAADTASLAKIASYKLSVTGVAAANLAALEANTHIANGSIGVSDAAANLSGGTFGRLSSDLKVASITVNDGNPIVLQSYSQYQADLGGIAKLTSGSVVNVTSVAVSNLTTLDQNSRVAEVGILDTAANLGGAVLGTLSSDAKVQTITVSDSNPLGLTYAQYAADGLGLAKITGTTYKLSITAATVASQAALDANSRVQAIAISDTAAALSGAALASLGADAKVKSIAVSTASPITLTYAQYTADSAAFAKITGTYSLNLTGVALASLSAVEQNSRVVGIGVSDTAAKLTSALATLGADSKVNVIVASDGKPLVLSVAQYTGGTQAIGKLPSGTKVSISDTAANLAAALGTLGSDGTVATIAVTDGLPLPLTYAQYAADTASLAKIASYKLSVTGVAAANLAALEANTHIANGSIGVSDAAANLSGGTFGRLSSDLKVASITVNDGNPIVLQSYSQYQADLGGIAKLVGGSKLSITDTAAKLSGAAFDGLEAHTSQIQTIGFSDKTPMLVLTRVQANADADLLTKVATPYLLNVTGVSGSMGSAFTSATTNTSNLLVLELSNADNSHTFTVSGSGLTLAAQHNDAFTITGHNDTISFGAAGFGADTVAGYTAGDVFSFSKSIFANYQALTSHVSGTSSAQITDTQGDSLLLSGVAASSLTSSMFRFV